MAKIDIFYVYVYAHRGVPIYVGKGKNGRAWSHLKRSSNRELGEYLAQFPDIEPNIYYRTHDEEEALALERALIHLYGRVCKNTGTLLNKASGGGKQGKRATESVIDRAFSILRDRDFIKFWWKVNSSIVGNMGKRTGRTPIPVFKVAGKFVADRDAAWNAWSKSR